MKPFNKFLLEQTSLEYHDVLNPHIWNTDQTLKSNVRNRLLQLANMWRAFSDIPDDSVKDIILTGGNANFNYTSLSDLDVHLLIDVSKMGITRDDLLFNYMIAKKDLWAVKHPNLKIMGYPVELFAQDYKKPVSNQQAFYSLQQDKWLKKPEHLTGLDFEHDIVLNRKIQIYSAMIEKILSESGNHLIIAKQIKNKLASGRAAGIQKGGEYSQENLLFKAIRNSGLLDKLKEYISDKEDDKLSMSD